MDRPGRLDVYRFTETEVKHKPKGSKGMKINGQILSERNKAT
jgi:hypothetical protein